MHSASRRLIQRRLPVVNIRRRNDRRHVASFWSVASQNNNNNPAAFQSFVSLPSFFPLQKIPKGFEDFFPPHGKSPPPPLNEANVHKSSSEPKSEKPPPHNNNNQNNPNDSANIPGLIALLLFIMALRNWLEQEDAERGHEITWQAFQQQFLGHTDTLTVINQNRVQFTTTPTADTPAQKYYFYIGSVERLEEKLAAAQQHLHPTEWVEVKYIQQTNLLLEFIKALPFLALPVAIHFGFRGLTGGATTKGGSQNMKSIFGIGKSTARKINKESVHVTFKDVAGCEQAKMEVMEFVDFLKDSERFTKLGAKIPKGALLCGPPGTGKTLLAKAVAGESGVPFFSISGSDFIEMFVGVGPSRVRDLFAEARANAPCIVFIDEIDAVGRQRGRGGFSGGGNDERENTLNQLLVEMDGFSPTTGVVVLAGTNRVDILDQALTRPGRFDRQITVDRPDLRGRQEIFLVHLAGLTLEGPAEDIAGRLAGLTPGFAGADIANLCNEAAIVAARRKAASVTIQDFEKATDRIIGGLESNKIMSKHEREIVAHHEAGHAIAGWFLEHADPLLKVTIIPRTSGALGFAQYLPKEVFLRSPEQIMDIVCMALAGRAAEQVFFGEVTTGASDDLRRVTQLVYSMIQEFGFNNRLGQLAFRKDPNSLEKPYSDSTAEAMDDEARRIVEEAYARTVELIESKKEQVDALAQLLLEKETITHDDIVDLVGARPFVGDKAYHQYVSSKSRGSPPVDEVAAEDKEDVGFDGPLTPGLA
ncbi:AFG3 family protein [Fistulifera solaris]|uniref:AFG3 family protein n=1 Tax=Fistulifera solaris TaxID=1519565 RepID=A0A1Z5KNN6_FISSO|nr:AFG3 family protein [Fistulifera solaris]|eukprot:GAX27548.1 AFG3 family protein [Fistulifera solaris]